MAHTMLINEPAKIYPYHLLVITNYRLPADVDRCNLEVSIFLEISRKPTCFVVFFFIKKEVRFVIAFYCFICLIATALEVFKK